MIDSPTIEYEDSSTLLPGMFRLAVTVPGQDEPQITVVQGSSAVLGRAPSCKCQLDHPGVSRRHAYLQAIYGRIYCLDLASRTGTFWGEMPRRGGWLDPDDVLRIGPFRVQFVDAIGIGTGGERLPDDFNPLTTYGGEFGPLPRIKIQHLGGGPPRFDPKIDRLITLVGSSPRCAFQIDESHGVAPIHCSLLWLRDGLWVVDLAGRGTTRVGKKSARCTRVEHGQKVRIGPLTLRVLYPGGEGPVAAFAPVGGSAADGEPVEVGASDLAQARVELDQQRELVAAERAQLDALRQRLEAERQAVESRLQQLDPKEIKLSEAQGRLAAEWDRLYAERAAAAAAAQDLLARQQALAEHARQLAVETEALSREREELAAQADHLAEIRRRMKVEWKKIQTAKVRLHEAKERLARDRSEIAQRTAALERRKPDGDEQSAADPDEVEPAPAAGGDAADSPDPLESMLHNKVFRTERDATTLIVTPLGDATDFHYGDVHVESNKIRRILDGGEFRDLVVDLGSVPVFSAVMINVIVALSRIVTNRGGRAVLCTASETTRSVFQSMKLLDLWPLFDCRDDALRAMRRTGGE